MNQGDAQAAGGEDAGQVDSDGGLAFARPGPGKEQRLRRCPARLGQREGPTGGGDRTRRRRGGDRRPG